MKNTKVLALAAVLTGAFALSAHAQLSAPFAGGIKLQQGGITSPALGLNMKAKQAYSSDATLNWVQPAGNGILKVSNWGANAGDVTVTTLDLSSASDIGTSVLGIANGGTGATTANGALNNLLPTQTGNNGKFLTTNGTSASWTTAVTSVGLSMPAEFTVSNSPVTSTGNLTASWAAQSGNKVFAAPADGSSGTPTFRNLVDADITSISATKITGTLPVSHGGTGATSFTGNSVITSNAAGDQLVATHLNDGEIMIGNTSGAPSAATLTAGAGISITNGGGSITIATNNANVTNKKRIPLNPTSYSYTGNNPPAGFTITATTVITITILEAGGYPITATVTNIDVANNNFDFVISGYPTANSFALVNFQN